jgi:oligogalacturonide transporter
MVPYAAMSSEITQDYEERNIVNGTRLFFSQCSSLVCAVLPLEIVKLFPDDEKKGYIVMAVAFGALFAVPFLLIFLFTKERVVSLKAACKFSLKDFAAPFKVRTFRILVTIYLSAFLSMDVVSNVYSYYMNYYLKRPGELNYILGAMLITQIAMVPLVIKLSNKLGKAETLKSSTIIWGVGIIYMALLQPNWPSWAVYVNAVVMGMGIIGCIVMPWMMFPDATDVGELASGKRNAGSYSGIMTFMRGLSSAIGIFIVSNILDFSGYIKPMENVAGDKTVKVLMEQPQGVISALKIIVVGFPFILLFATYLSARKYPLTRQIHEKLIKHLEYMRGNAEVKPLDESEVKQLEKTLI